MKDSSEFGIHLGSSIEGDFDVDMDVWGLFYAFLSPLPVPSWPDKRFNVNIAHRVERREINTISEFSLIPFSLLPTVMLVLWPGVSACKTDVRLEYATSTIRASKHTSTKYVEVYYRSQVVSILYPRQTRHKDGIRV